MTSNVGARMITEPKKLGFNIAEDDRKENYENIKDNVMAELKKAFRPEFLNRVDEIIVFHQLEKEHLKQIASLMLDKLIDRLKANRITVEITEAAKEFLVKDGFDINFGARPLRRTIQSKVEDKLAEEILEGSVKPGENIIIDADNNEIVLKK